MTTSYRRRYLILNFEGVLLQEAYNSGYDGMIENIVNSLNAGIMGVLCPSGFLNFTKNPLMGYKNYAFLKSDHKKAIFFCKYNHHKKVIFLH